MEKTLAFINNAAREGRIGNYKWIRVQINGIWCWKTKQQIEAMNFQVKFRSARK